MIRRFLKKFKVGEKGFTLIELLVVIAILGVLAAVAIPNVSKFIGKGKVEAANTELATVQTGLAAWQADNATNTFTGTIQWSTLEGYVSEFVQNPLMYEYTATNTDGKITVEGVDDAGSAADAAGLQWSGEPDYKWEPEP